MSDVLDMLRRPIKIGDYVVSYNYVYTVLSVPASPKNGVGQCKVMLIDKSKTTIAKYKSSSDMCLISTEDVVIWKLARGW